MSQAISNRCHTADARFYCQASPCGICGVTKWHCDRFLGVFVASSVSIVSSVLHIHASASDACH